MYGLHDYDRKRILFEGPANLEVLEMHDQKAVFLRLVPS